MKTKNYTTVETVPKSNWKILETYPKSSPLTLIHLHWYSHFNKERRATIYLLETTGWLIDA